MKRSFLAVLVTAAFVAGTGCGADPEPTAADTTARPAEAVTTQPAASENTTPATTETTASDPATTETTASDASAAERAYEVWVVDRGFVRPAWRLGAGGEAVARTALDLLLAEPRTAIPAGTDVRAVHVFDSGAHVDLSPELGARPPRRALAQIVYTLTQFESVGSVLVTVKDAPLAKYPEPLTRKQFEDVLAPVVVESPTGLEPVTSPIHVSGTANTFEANVTLRVLGAGGKELASTFATATCGTGCRGDYETDVEVAVSSETHVTLVVGEDDPSGGEGRPPYTIEIPLVLRPGR